MSPVAELLAAGGAPERLVAPVTAALGPDDPAAAAAVLAADPWRLLEVPGVRPEQADAYASVVLASAYTTGDPRRATGHACWLLRRAAADGHTALPAGTLLAALGGAGPAGSPAASRLQTSVTADGRVVAVTDPATPDRPLLALATLAEHEASLADGLSLLAESEPDPVDGLPATGLTLVVGPVAAGRRAYVAALTAAADAAGLRVARASGAGLTQRAGVLATADVAVVEDAELLGLADAAALLEELTDGQRLVLVGDPELLPGRGPGQVLADSVAAGLPALTLPPAPPPGSVLDTLRAGVRDGRLLPVDDPARTVVVVPADDATAVRRTVQLVTDSIPRALGVAADDVLVVTPRRSGVVGASALDMALATALDGPGARARATTVHEAQGRRARAVVVVLPAESAGSLSRPLVATAFGLAEDHLSVVHACGPALAEAVARVAGRPRLTRLAGLLRTGAPSLVGAA